MSEVRSVEYDTNGTEAAVCPHCGHVDTDSCDLGDSRRHSGTAHCDACDKPFQWEREIEVTYTTRKP